MTYLIMIQMNCAQVFKLSKALGLPPRSQDGIIATPAQMQLFNSRTGNTEHFWVQIWLGPVKYIDVKGGETPLDCFIAMAVGRVLNDNFNYMLHSFIPQPAEEKQKIFAAIGSGMVKSSVLAEIFPSRHFAFFQ